MKKIFLLILTIVILFMSCSKKEPLPDMAKSSLNPTPHNETKASLSPDGRYRAEAYGTDTSITAGGLFPYEGIRIINTDNDSVVWEMEPGYYTVDFSWSADSRYVGIYYEARIWGESIVFDIEKGKVISLPSLDDIVSHYDDSVKPQENRPDPYFKISGWKDEKTVIVDFHWYMKDAEDFSGQYIYDIENNTVSFKDY